MCGRLGRQGGRHKAGLPQLSHASCAGPPPPPSLSTRHFSLPALPAPFFPSLLQPIWVDAKYVSPEVIDDFESGLEYAQAAAVVGMRQRGTMRKYLVR